MKRSSSSRLLPCAVLATSMFWSSTSPTWGQDNPGPIIDMHLHAKHADELGPPPLFLCAPFAMWPVKDTQEDPQTFCAGAK